MNATTITTGRVRLSYCHLFTPAPSLNSDIEKYSVSVIIDKKDKATLAKIEKAIEEAKKQGATAKWGGKVPAKLRTPLRDGDEDRPDDPAYAGAYFFNCSSKNKPNVVDENIEEIINPSEVYSGCYGRVNVNFYAYDVSGNRGIGVGLNSVQKLADGEPLGGAAPSAREAFGDDDDMLD